MNNESVPESNGTLCILPGSSVSRQVIESDGTYNSICSFDSSTNEGRMKIWKTGRTKATGIEKLSEERGFRCNDFCIRKTVYKDDEGNPVDGYKVAFFYEDEIQAVCISRVVASQLIEYVEIWGMPKRPEYVTFLVLQERAGKNIYYTLEIVEKA